MGVGWQGVTEVSNIRITVEGGQPAATIFGNTRNSVKVTIILNGKGPDGFINLSQEDLTRPISLVDYQTAENLPWEYIDPNGSGLYYSDLPGPYNHSYVGASSVTGNPSFFSRDAPIRDDLKEMQGKVTYYLYGQSKIDIKYQVAAKIMLWNGTVLYTTLKSGRGEKVDLLVLRPLVYGISDLDPFEWTFVKRTKKWTQYNCFVRPKERTWADSKMQTTYKMSHEYKAYVRIAYTNKESQGYKFYASEIDKESYFLDDQEKIEYNQVKGSFCMIMLVSPEPHPEISIDEEFRVSLHDHYGNLAKYRLTWDDLSRPMLMVVNQ